MKRILLCVLIGCALLSSSALAFENSPFKMREDFGTAPLQECILQYYYYVPCPTYSWFWAFTGFNVGDVIGAWFEIGDVTTGAWDICDPLECHTLEQIRVLDFAGYGTVHPGIFTIEFDIFCCDQYGCPVGPPLWNSGHVNTAYAWNYFVIDPPLCITPCATDPGPPPAAPRILITSTWVGSDATYPAWGTDNISTPVLDGCVMHDTGCLPALYPRPYNSHYGTMHSGYYGFDFSYCPPQGWKDQNDPTADGSQYGYLELAWRIYMVCSGPTETEPTTWSDIKAIYR